VGDGVCLSALPLLALAMTRDPRLIALVSAAVFVPWLAMSLPTGVVVDRYDRGMLMRRSQVVQGLTIAMVAVLVLVHEVDIALLVLLAFLLGSAEVIFSNAAQSLLPDLVPPEQLPKANGNLQVSLTVGETFVGPPLGSVLFGLDACSFFGSAATAGHSRRREADRPVTGPARASPPRRHRWMRCAAGC
jgi:MFS family permease